MKFKKFFRTVQVYIPYFQETKAALVRAYRQILQRPAEEDFNALTLFPNLEQALLLDVGANRGQSTDAMLMKAPKSAICSFEPNPLLSEKLQRLYQAFPQVTIQSFGLGAEDETLVFYIPFYRQWMFDGLASFDDTSAREYLQKYIYFYNEASLELRQVKCQVKRLDDLHLAPFFIKLDVQGYELPALTGGQNTLKTHEPVLLIEAPDPLLASFLQRLGYTPYAFRAGKFVAGEYGQPNTFFMTKSKAELVRQHLLT